jgi:hypothetical protein
MMAFIPTLAHINELESRESPKSAGFQPSLEYIEELESRDKQPPADQAPPGLYRVGEDIAESLATAPQAGLETLAGLPEHAASGYEYLKKHPFKSIGQALLGGVEGLAGLFSSKQELDKYLNKRIHGNTYKDLPSFLKPYPTPYELLMKGEKALGLEPTEKGEAEVRGLGQFPLAIGGIPAIAAAVAGQGGDPLHAALGAKLAGQTGKLVKKVPGKISKAIKTRQEIEKIPEMEKAALGAEEKLGSDAESLQKLQDALEIEHGTKKETGLIRKQIEAKQKAEELKPIAEQEPVPEHLLAEEPQAPKSRLPEAQEQTVASAEDLQKHIFHKDEPGNIASKNLVSDFKSKIKNPATKLYKANDAAVAKETVEVPAKLNPETKSSIESLKRLANQEGWGEVQKKSLQDALAKLESKTEKIPAKDLYTAARTASQLATRNRNAAYKMGVTDAEHKDLTAKAKALDAQSDNMFSILEQVPFKKNIMKNLKKANALWTDVKAIENNSLFKQMLSKGRVEGSILEKLGGTETGVNKLNELVSANPETIRAAFGHSYAKKPRSILEMNNRERALANKVPEMMQKISDMEQKLANEPLVKELDTVRADQHQELIKAMKEAKAKHAEIEKAKKEYKKKLELDKNLESKIKMLRQRRRRKDLSTAEKAKIDETLKKTIEMKNKGRNRMKALAKVIGAGMLGSKAASVVNKIIK